MLFTERFYATVSCFKNPSGVVGFILAAFVLVSFKSAFKLRQTYSLKPINTFKILSPMPQIIMYNANVIDYERVYCASVTSTTQQNSHSSGVLLIMIDYAITIADLLLLIFNRYQIKRYKK